jgi:hypothetical protein
VLNRVLALAALALGLAACAGGEESPHARVACVGCHREAGAGAGRAGVPDRACTVSGCHEEGGPDTARVAMVRFRHRAHPLGDSAAVPCASCHTHGTDSLGLAAGSAACTLCHQAAIAGRADSACVACHVNPMHTRSTSEGLSLPHAELRDASVPCTRCHYRLLAGSTAVARERCVACHERGRPAASPVRALPPDSAHRRHRDLACTACHERLEHRVVAMSSSVRLDCLECHSLRHSPPVVAADTAPDSTCGDCHRAIHQDEQRIILGLLPGQPPEPSGMFMGGVTCRSCHVVPGQDAPRPGASRKGSAAACTGCHGGAWNDVLARWRRGYRRRLDIVNAYLRGAAAALGDSAAARAVPAAAHSRLREARELLAFADRAGPLHNLPVTDHLMRRALALGAEAYRAAGRTAPAQPLLGPRVENGTCIACHYGVEEAPLWADSVGGRRGTHADHIFRAGLTCDNCHAAGAAPPGFSGRRWIDTLATPPARPDSQRQ